MTWLERILLFLLAIVAGVNGMFWSMVLFLIVCVSVALLVIQREQKRKEVIA